LIWYVSRRVRGLFAEVLLINSFVIDTIFPALHGFDATLGQIIQSNHHIPQSTRVALALRAKSASQPLYDSRKLPHMTP